MRIVMLGTARSTPIERFGSHGVAIGSVAVVEDVDLLSVSVATISAGGEIGRHETRLWQLFYVVDGSGWVSGDGDERTPISAGMAASWQPGEVHASGSRGGLTACIIESSTNPISSLLDHG